MASSNVTTHQHYHVVGAAGVGMNPLAQVLMAQGNIVTGSDRYFDQGQNLDIIRKLENAGIRFVPQDGKSITSATKAVVISTAIENDNPDISAARQLNIPILHRAEMLADLAKGHRSIAVTGTSGKSTVTGMLGVILTACGHDPTVVNGAVVLDWQDANNIGNIRNGKSDLWLLEADESDKSLMNFHPDWAIITNASADHFGTDETHALFKKFSGQVKKGVVSRLYNPELFEEFAPTLTRAGSEFVFHGISFRLNLQGLHNAENAYYALHLAKKLGCDLEIVRDALEKFKGIQRRLEFIGEVGDIKVIDDYAHNPAKISASWKALASTADRLIAIWRPHGYGPLRSMLDDLVEQLPAVVRKSDLLYILPVYDVGGTANRSINSDILAERLAKTGMNVNFVKHMDYLKRDIINSAKPGDTIVTMGARDPQLPVMAREILEALPSNSK